MKKVVLLHIAIISVMVIGESVAIPMLTHLGVFVIGWISFCGFCIMLFFKEAEKADLYRNVERINIGWSLVILEAFILFYIGWWITAVFYLGANLGNSLNRGFYERKF